MGNFFHGMYKLHLYKLLQKVGWATVWVIFFTNPSGHPDLDVDWRANLGIFLVLIYILTFSAEQ
jgi:hypothetical protein